MPNRTCGISFESNAAVVVILNKANEGVEVVECETKRIDLGSHEEDSNLKSFSRIIEALVKDYKVEQIAIRKCTYSGKYQSGAASLKMEAVLQLVDVPTVLLSSQQITKRFDACNIDVPPTLNKYQHDAFKAACATAII